eukprot:10438972-Karenia_brevis.AAC.1
MRRRMRALKRRLGRVLARPLHDKVLVHVRQARSSLVQPLRAARSVIRSVGRMRFLGFINSTAEKITQSSFKAAPRVAWQAIKKLMSTSRCSKWRRSRTIPLLYDSEGKPAESAAR